MAELTAALRSVSAHRIAARIRELGSIGGTPDGGVTRLGFTVEERAARELVTSWLSAIGYRCSVDDAGNLFCSIGDPPRLLVGSHLDSVPNGGRYDGSLGVVAAAELAEAIHAGGLEVPLEVVAWSAEEGATYRPGHFGSAAAFGQLPADAWDRELLDGRVVRHAIRSLLEHEPEPSTCLRTAAEFRAYVELHMEQGPKLAADERPLGVVTEIVGMTRGRIALSGRADHAGSTPMAARADALAAAAECVLVVEGVARETRDLVGTVGELHVSPGAGNVVPGRVRFSVELRSPLDATRRAALEEIVGSMKSVCARRGIGWTVETMDEIPATPMSADLAEILERSCVGVGHAPKRMPSGAGHDAQNVSIAGIPTGMLFVRSVNGSHNPSEYVDAEDAAAGVRAMLVAADALVPS